MIDENQLSKVLNFLDVSSSCNSLAEAEEMCGLLLSIPLRSIPVLLQKKTTYLEVTASNIPQFSDASIAFYRVPVVLAEESESLSYLELGGKIFPSPTIIAQKKYGENHGKLATLLGLAESVKKQGGNAFSTSNMGRVFCKLTQDEKDALLQRLCYRIPIIQQMALSNNPYEKMENCMLILAESTRDRRRKNVKDLFDFSIDA